MHHDPLNRKREEYKLSVGEMVRHAVELFWQNPGADSRWRQGITELIARTGYQGSHEEASRAIKDCAEEMEQDIANEIDRAETDLKAAEARLAAANSKQPKETGEVP